MSRKLIDVLNERFPGAKRQTLKRMVLADRVLVNGRPVRRLDAPLADADRVETVDRIQAGERQRSGAAPSGPPRASARRSPAPPPLNIIYEDDDLLVVNKPAGLLTSTVPCERRPTLLAAVRAYVAQTDPGRPVGLIHRLDRDASGLLVFSKSDVAYQSLKSQFFHHRVERLYSAIVRGAPVPPAGRIESRLIERADGTVRSTRQHARGQRAVTHYEVIGAQGGGNKGRRSLLRVRLETGRKHQIRVHLSERGWPIVGDVLYGPEKSTTSLPHSPLLLTAMALEFNHPATGNRVRFEIEPKELW